MAQKLPYIPETITVHLGLPNRPAQNVTLPFPDYIKNVASSEIYPTWPESAVRANIYAQITYALNRVYNEFYRSQGYDFDITSTTQFDQKFILGRDIFKNISRIVDEIFNDYVVKEGRIDPYFTAYCNGTTVTCDGLSQWGTVGLAKAGYTPYEILQYYYGRDIGIVKNAPVAQNVESYPGRALRIGSSGNDVLLIQQELDRIAENYPAIPRISSVNGVFGAETKRAVESFQRIFNLPADGVVGKSTWYQLKYIYNGVKKLNELASEGLTLPEVTGPYPSVLKKGMQGGAVQTVQYYLAVAGYFTPALPTIRADGIFGTATENAVKAFQRYAGLPADGIVGRNTWNALDRAYQNILSALPPQYQGKKAVLYPGYVLSEGMQNGDVAVLQNYLRAIGEYYGTLPLLPVTGYFGSQTKRVTELFQKQNGIPPAGVVGAVTWGRIASLYDARVL